MPFVADGGDIQALFVSGFELLDKICIRARNWWPRLRVEYLWITNHPVMFQTVPLNGISFFLLGLFIMAAVQPLPARDTALFTFLGDQRFARSTALP
jgi:hypothetical protein